MGHVAARLEEVPQRARSADGDVFEVGGQDEAPLLADDREDARIGEELGDPQRELMAPVATDRRIARQVLDRDGWYQTPAAGAFEDLGELGPQPVGAKLERSGSEQPYDGAVRPLAFDPTEAGFGIVEELLLKPRRGGFVVTDVDERPAH